MNTVKVINWRDLHVITELNLDGKEITLAREVNQEYVVIGTNHNLVYVFTLPEFKLVGKA